MAYLPDCDNPEVRRILPTLCSYPPDVRAQICERQPSLCIPVDYEPSIWEPIWGTASEVGKRILVTEAAVGTGMLGTLNLATMLAGVLPFLLVGGGVYYLMQSGRR
jgi:hypothetical protein